MAAKPIPPPKPTIEPALAPAIVTRLVVTGLVAVPVVHSGLFLHSYSVPKFVVLLIVSAMTAGVLAYSCLEDRPATERGRSRAPAFFAFLIAVYILALALSTILGVSPVISAQGSFQALMGLSTYVCFAVLAVAVGGSASYSLANFKVILRAIVVAGLVVSLVGVGQFAGIIEIDPGAAAVFGDRSRVYATLGVLTRCNRCQQSY